MSDHSKTDCGPTNVTGMEMTILFASDVASMSVKCSNTSMAVEGAEMLE